MTSVPSRQQPLSGSNRHRLWILLGGILFISVACGTPRKTTSGTNHPSSGGVVKRDTVKKLPVFSREKQTRDSIDRIFPLVLKDRYRIDIFAPFFLDDADRLKNHKTQVTVSDDYFRGITIAGDTLEKCGFKADLRFYDTENEGFNYKTVNDTLTLSNPDLIFGPILESRLSYLDSFAELKKINSVSPIISGKCRHNDYRFESLPDNIILGNAAARMVKSTYSGYKIILINDKNLKNNEAAQAFISEIGSDSVSVIDFSGRSAAMYFPDLQLGEKNVIFISSSNEVFISAVFAQLRVNTNEIVVVGELPWLFFKTIEGDLWERFNVHIPAQYFIDYKSGTANNFIRTYRAKYNTEPSVWAMIGFDELYYYGSLMAQYGKYFQRGYLLNANMDRTMLHTRYEIVKDMTGCGWKNSYVNMLKFQDYELKPVMAH